MLNAKQNCNIMPRGPKGEIVKTSAGYINLAAVIHIDETKTVRPPGATISGDAPGLVARE
jgi:hypothetical protein